MIKMRGGFVLSYTELNTLLVERFGDLERLCNQIYNAQHGVTNYIMEMENLRLIGNSIMADWNFILKRLKDVRHKRNKLSHGEVSFSDPWANEDDINFVVNFRNSIMTQTDPITIYTKHSKQKAVKKTNQQYHPTDNTTRRRIMMENDPILLHMNNSKENTSFPIDYKSNRQSQKNSSAGCLTLIASFLIVVVGIILLF
jgi:hypothetical protein